MKTRHFGAELISDRLRGSQRLMIAVGATILAFLIRWGLDPVLKDRYPFATTMFAVILVAWHADFIPAFVTLVLGFLLADWYFVEPRHSLVMADMTNLAGDFTFFFIGFTILLFARSMHLARRRADASAHEAIEHQKRLELEVIERKRAEEEVRQLNSGLEQRVAQRTEELLAANRELEAFTYSVSHDLRAPLRHIDGYAQMLEEECGANLSSTAQRCVSKIRHGSQHMGRLVDDLLNLSRVGKAELNLQSVALSSVVEEVLAELKPETNGRQIEWLVGSLPTAECDPGLIKLVFANLLTNAAKYTRSRASAKVEVNQSKADGETVIFVRDNGVGFSMKYAHKLFGVFQRLHRAEEFEGTGVGLAIVQRIIRKHGGRIWAEAEVDKGAAFFFTLGRIAGLKPTESLGSVEPKPEVLLPQNTP